MQLVTYYGIEDKFEKSIECNLEMLEKTGDL